MTLNLTHFFVRIPACLISAPMRVAFVCFLKVKLTRDWFQNNDWQSMRCISGHRLFGVRCVDCYWCDTSGWSRGPSCCWDASQQHEAGKVSGAAYDCKKIVFLSLGVDVVIKKAGCSAALKSRVETARTIYRRIMRAWQKHCSLRIASTYTL